MPNLLDLVWEPDLVLAEPYVQMMIKLRLFLVLPFYARVQVSLATLVMLFGLSAVFSGEPETNAWCSDVGTLVRSERGVELLHAGRAEIAQFKLARAEATFSELAAQADGNVAGAFYLETIALLKFLMSDEDRHREAFFERSKALKKALSQTPDSPWRVFLGAEANVHTAVARAKRGQFLRAALDSRSAYGGYSKLIECRPDFYDAYKGLGILHAAIGSSTGTYRWLLGALGFKGTVEQGRREIRLAAVRSELNREEAQIFLVMLDMKLFGASDEADAVFATLMHTYEDSPLLAYLYGSYLYETRRAVEAEQVFRTAVNQDGDGEHFYIDYVDYFLAEVLFRQNRFDEAAVYYRRYLDRHVGPALKASATFALGLSLEMQGARDRALPYYQQVKAERDFDSDAASKRRAQHRLDAPLSDRERTLLLGQNAYDAGRYEEAHDILRAISDDPAASREERAEAAYRHGRAFQAQGKQAEALAAYASAVQWHGDPASRWAPWAQYYTGLLLEDAGDTTAAAEAFRAALDYKKKYDYRQALKANAKVALNRVKEDG